MRREQSELYGQGVYKAEGDEAEEFVEWGRLVWSVHISRIHPGQMPIHMAQTTPSKIRMTEVLEKLISPMDRREGKDGVVGGRREGRIFAF